MKFYNEFGAEISKESFIADYSGSYYLGGPRKLKGVSQNSRFIEGEMEKLLETGIHNPTDIVHILAWKIGKLKHSECEEYGKFVYTSDWENAENFDMRRYNKQIEVEGLAQYIAANIKGLEERTATDPQGVLNDLAQKAPDGIGSVYLVTLLYFISKGKVPIYDRFAMLALRAIMDDNAPAKVKMVDSLPDKGSKGFASLMTGQMADYISALKTVFGTEYQTNRDIDRALWVYGHYSE